ncbi:MAG: O-sialoglycoprotein endopeptidase [Negativicutes bacterium]|nr:O-sialoglycoprotein endopeptidase [Negativicutes bacterium]
MNEWVLGIDTSNYTTSLAAVTLDHQLLHQQRQLLSVAMGERGLRQSEAVFAHLRSISQQFLQLERPDYPPVAIGVSNQPRSLPGSYMPVFLVGNQFAAVLSQMLKIPLYTYSHQEGHIKAGLFSAGEPDLPQFLSVHLSGGTTELLLVKQEEHHFRETILAATDDISAGQLIDRIGVAMGLPFPAGPALEKLAQTSHENLSVIPAAYHQGKLSFSGAESQAMRLLQSAAEPAEIARAVENCVVKSLEKMIRSAIETTKIKDVLLVGGVTANRYLRDRLRHKLEHPAVSAHLYFASPELSSDNAVGIAFLAAEAFSTGGLRE